MWMLCDRPRDGIVNRMRIERKYKYKHALTVKIMQNLMITFQNCTQLTMWMTSGFSGIVNSLIEQKVLLISINQSINFYLLKMSRDTHKRLFNCEQDNMAETNTNSCPTNKLYYERKRKTQRVQNSLRWRAHTLYQVLYDTRCYFNVRSKADISQLNLPHGTDN